MYRAFWKSIINISVEEKPTGELSLGAGIGTGGASLGGSITEKNFLGKGVTLNSSFEISEESLKGSINYAQPYFNNNIQRRKKIKIKKSIVVL